MTRWTMSIFFNTQEAYRNFTTQHALAMLVVITVYVLVIRLARCCVAEPGQKRIWMALTFLPLISLALRTWLDSSIRDLNLQEDLPLHLCRILSLAAPIVVFSGREKAIRIFYYLVLAGVANAMITPEITYGFPHYGFILYWLYHASLVLLVLYGILVFGVKLSLRDGWHAFLTVNIYFLVLHGINRWIGSNYMYSRHKPGSATVMDYLGDWPVYLIWLEFIALGLILLIYLIFSRLMPQKDPGKAIKDS